MVSNVTGRPGLPTTLVTGTPKLPETSVTGVLARRFNNRKASDATVFTGNPIVSPRLVFSRRRKCEIDAIGRIDAVAHDDLHDPGVLVDGLRRNGQCAVAIEHRRSDQSSDEAYALGKEPGTGDFHRDVRAADRAGIPARST